METLELKQTERKLVVEEAALMGSTFNMVCLNNAQFTDVAITDAKIVNANLSDLEIEGAQIGGAYIHNIGMPPADHPYYDPTAKHRPVRFEHCDLNRSTFTECDLTNVEISNCDITGMTINGVQIEVLLAAFKSKV